jgi:endonuclease/exonuclease/phosphatase family metal-dependent hydrolase
MTYNVRIGVGGGPWHTEPARISLEPVARLIEEHAPDLIGLQEVDQARQRSGRMDQPAFLSARLKMSVEFVPAYTVAVTHGMDEKYGVAMLSRGRIVSSERIPLFKPDYSRETKYPDYYSEQRVLMHAEVLIEGWKVHVFVTHLGLTEDQREKQLKQIAETAARFEGPKILMGDFNANPSEPAMKFLEPL